MNKNIGVVVALLVAVGVGYAKLGPPGEHARVQREIDELDAQLPRSLGTQVTMTRIELHNKTVTSRYKIDATFETDPETTAAIRKLLLRSACLEPKFRDVLAKGYVFDNVVDVDTPHDPGQFNLQIAAGDCA
jgi:hypothetical protein